MRGFVGSLYSRLAWSLLEAGRRVARAASTIEPAPSTPGDVCAARTSCSSPTPGRRSSIERKAATRTAATAANEALHIHETNGASRFRNRIDPDFEIASVLAVCHTVLAVIAVEQGDPDDRRRRGWPRPIGSASEVGAPVPRFQVDDLERARGRSRAGRVSGGQAPGKGLIGSWGCPQQCGPDPGGLPMSAFLYRLGRSCARHPFRVLGLWLVAAVAVVTLQGAAGGHYDNSIRVPGVESQRAADTLRDRFPAPERQDRPHRVPHHRRPARRRRSQGDHRAGPPAAGDRPRRRRRHRSVRPAVQRR